MRSLPTSAHTLRTLAITLLLLTMLPASAAAFCGFYVAGSGDELYNDATQVVLMRKDTTTVLSMENNYRGPLEDFAMVIPVPQVLMEENVKTLDPDIFRRVDKLSAPRLVQYWEEDPCQNNVFEYNTYINGCQYDYYNNASNNNAYYNNSSPIYDMASSADQGQAPPVMIEAQFAVGEYEILILSSEEATGLETWLTANNYKIPAGATEIFEQYIQQGMYFFVAKVDPAKVTFKDGQAVLSPLRFDYDSETFQLPVRLGMVNSSGEQDLITYILGQGQRYEVANYPNVFIPTNIEVSQDVKDGFGTFYTKLFARTVKQNPGAVVTEYSWDASTCDPCPGPTLDFEDYATLGADVLEGGEEFSQFGRGWTLTRLHARYGKDGLTDDLVFQKAGPVVGGREVYDAAGRLETGAKPAEYGSDNFQGRYIMRNRWTGAVDCEDPQFGRWGGPPSGVEQPSTGTALSPNTRGEPSNIETGGTSIEDRELETLVKEDIEDIDVTAQNPTETGNNDSGRGCSSAGTAGGGAGLVFALLGMLGISRRRKRSA